VIGVIISFVTLLLIVLISINSKSSEYVIDVQYRHFEIVGVIKTAVDILGPRYC